MNIQKFIYDSKISQTTVSRINEAIIWWNDKRIGSRINEAISAYGFFGELTAEDERKIEEALQTVHASHLTERFFDEWSDGEKQKVLVARAFVQEPEVIILDEPTTGILHENDVDFEVARTIGLDILREKAFEPIQETTFK